MIRLTVEAAAAAVGGTVLQVGAASEFHGVTIDSRAVNPGSAFVAIRGHRFDGHDYALVAAEAGAALLVISGPIQPPPPDSIAIIRVEDTVKALGQLGQAWLARVNPRILAVTGSVGKTTTKELLRGIMEQTGPTHATPGNFNNNIGLPLTLLTMPADTRNLILEMGMNHPGEIAALAALARPEVGLITAIAPVHLEGLGTMEAIAAAKAELLTGLRRGGAAVIPGNEPLLDPWKNELASTRLLTFGEDPGCDVQLLGRDASGQEGALIRLSIMDEEVEIKLQLVGRHNAMNAAAAAAAALAARVEPETIARGLSSPLRLEHRSTLVTVGPYTVLDDCYNASPAAVRAALDTLGELAAGAPRAAILGAMLELGPEQLRYHRELGAHAASAGIDLLVTVGELGAEIARGAAEAGLPRQRCIETDTPAEAAHALTGALEEGWVLIKASHGARLDRALEALNKTHNTEAES